MTASTAKAREEKYMSDAKAEAKLYLLPVIIQNVKCYSSREATPHQRTAENHRKG